MHFFLADLPVGVMQSLLREADVIYEMTLESGRELL
jgi:hypothetical protein